MDVKQGTSKVLPEKSPKTSSNLSKEMMKFYSDHCQECNEDRTVKCYECGCSVCGRQDAEEKRVFCENCQSTTHICCLDPPLQNLPEGDWFCASCVNYFSEIFLVKLKVCSLFYAAIDDQMTQVIVNNCVPYFDLFFLDQRPHIKRERNNKLL